MDKDFASKQLRAKSRGFNLSIEKMSDVQRSETPSGIYGEDYNSLLHLTKSNFPELQPFLPPPVSTYGSGGKDRFTTQSYGEIDTYCEQIFQLLSELEE